MIDYVNIGLRNKGLAMKILAKPLFEFEMELSTNKHKIYKGTYKNMKVEIYEPSYTIKIKGSLHYLYNNGLHNYNDFSYVALCMSIKELTEAFEFAPAEALLHGLEFGVNIELPFAPAHFISNVMAYKSAKLTIMNKGLPINEALNINNSQYRLKLYDKGKQFAVEDKQVLRVEYKAIKMASLKSIVGLDSLASLQNKKVLIQLGQKLLKEFETLIVTEPLAEGISLPEKDLAKYTKMNNRAYWQAIKNPSNKRNAKAVFKVLLSKYGNGMHSNICELIRQIWGELVGADCQQYEPKVSAGIGMNLPALLPAQNTPLALFDHLDNRLNNAYYNTINHNYPFKIKKCSNCRKVLPDNTKSYCNASCKAKKDIRINKTTEYSAGQSLLFTF